MNKIHTLAIATLAGLGVANVAVAHATFANGTLETGSHVAAALQVPHSLKGPAPILKVAAAGQAADPHAGHGAMNAADPMPAMFEPVKVGDLELTAGFTRAMLPGQPVGGGFITIHNGGSEDDTLIAAESPSAGHMELHEMAMVNDVMQMRPLKDGIPVPAGETVELKPGGLHMMFMAVKEPFVEGATVNVKLTFAKAGSVDLVLPVGPARGM